ncbi:MAG: polysaccharide deacetylase family protein [Verrucomicrobiaceae bacterium]|nr:MAG: polysaccharide deacetylase family protein [Verrucomicrobiaceae bacterium]
MITGKSLLATALVALGYLAVPDVGCLAARPDASVQDPDLSQSGTEEGREIAFVFEDGPLPHTTPILLDALKKLGMKATFAVTGENVESNPGLARRIVAEGHELANHTYSNPDLKRLDLQDIIWQMRVAGEAITRVTGVKPRYFRSTNGELSESLRALVEQEGYEVLDSTLDSGDWRNPSSEKLRQTVLTKVAPGSVVLAHDSFPKTVKEMPAVLEALVKRGFRLCTVSELHPGALHEAPSASLPLDSTPAESPQAPLEVIQPR